MSKQKRHHYVPVTYLEKWASTKNEMLMHKHQSGKIFPSKPSNVFVEGHLYKVKGLEDELHFENAYSEIEGAYKNCVKVLRTSENIDQKQFESLSNFMAHQVLRTKAARNLADLIFEEMFKEGLDKQNLEGKYNFSQDEILGFSKSVKLAEEWKTMYLFDRSESMKHELVKKDWMFVSFPNGRLLTSSNPISFVLENDQVAIAGAETAKFITWPLSRNLALLLSNRKGVYLGETQCTLKTAGNDDLSNLINRATVMGAQNGIVWHPDDERYLSDFIKMYHSDADKNDG